MLVTHKRPSILGAEIPLVRTPPMEGAGKLFDLVHWVCVLDLVILIQPNRSQTQEKQVGVLSLHGSEVMPRGMTSDRRERLEDPVAYVLDGNLVVARHVRERHRIEIRAGIRVTRDAQVQPGQTLAQPACCGGSG